MRYEPRMPAPLPDGTVRENVLNCLPDGFVGLLDAYGWGGKATLPEFADGRWWWHIVGQGWAADEFLAFHHQGGLPWPKRPDLATAGLIAYLRSDNSIWLMNADGSNPRPIVAGKPNQWVQGVQWSPEGGRLAFSLGRADGTFGTRVVDLNGNILMEIPGLSEPRWSPSGERLAGVRSSPGGLGGYQATPVVYDMTTGAEWAIGPANHSYVAPAWSPDGNSLAFICVSGYVGQPDGTTAIDEASNCNGDGLRVVSADGSNPRVLVPAGTPNGGYFYGPAWSPSGQTIAITTMQQGDGCRGYALVDVASGGISGCISPPGMAAFSGGGCGGPSMSAPTWTPGGRLVFFVPGVGQSGFYVHDPATRAQAFIPNMNAGQASLAPDGLNFTFGSGFIWVAGLDGSNLTLLAEGHSPVWQPVP